MNDDTRQKLLCLIQSRFARSATAENTFADLEIDSLAMAEFSLAIEKEFDVRLDEQVLEVTTVGEMVQYVERLRQ
jgi:acyl carrier protein